MGVEKVVKFATENQEYIAEIKKALNITDDLTMREMDSIIEWSEYQFGPDIIIEAIRRTREGKKGAGSRGIIFPYVSALLKIWRDAEIKTIQDIDDYTNQMIQVNARKQQYRQTQKATVEVRSIQPEPYYRRSGLVDLKPCPFCGCSEIVIKNQYSSKHNAYYTMAECSLCGIRTRSSVNFTDAEPSSEEFWRSESVQEVAGLWNKRV